MIQKASIATACLALAACAGGYGSGDPVAPKPEPKEWPPEGQCDAQYAQHHIGDTVTQELGLVIRDETGAQRLRWGPPNSAWTMDYREDRVNVRYDADMAITAITCG